MIEACSLYFSITVMVVLRAKMNKGVYSLCTFYKSTTMLSTYSCLETKFTFNKLIAPTRSPTLTLTFRVIIFLPE